MPPRDTIALARIPGRKKKKERNNCLASCNADGTEKIPLFFVGKSENPRCFNGKKSSELNIQYTNSPRAWMNFSIFSAWLKEFDIYVSKTPERRVALLLDNASAHGKLKIFLCYLMLKSFFFQKIQQHFYNR